MLTPALVPFRGQTLLTVRDGEQVRVAIRPICEALGLNWSAQYRRLLRTPVLAKRVTKMAMPSAGGSQDTLTLPLDLLNGWLFGIDVQRVRPERREALIAYQEECYAVLARHRGIAPRRALPAGHQLAAHRLRARLLAQMGRSRSRAEQQALHEQLVQLSSELGLDCPPLADFAEPAPNARLLADFWAAVLALLGSGERLNHARNPALLALNLGEVSRAAEAAGRPLPARHMLAPALRQSTGPRFLACKAVNSALTGRTVKCWVFEAGSGVA